MRGIDIVRDAEKNVNSLASNRAEAFDAWPVHNSVYESILQDDQLLLAADVAARAAEPNDMRRGATESGYAGDSLIKALSDAEIGIEKHLDLRVEEIIAEACADTLVELDEWREEDPDYCDEETAAQAKREAANWLLEHREVCERIDIGAPGEAAALASEVSE